MRLSIEIGSDPIAGSLSVDAGASQAFSGWIELVAAIESARHAGLSEAEEHSGANGGRTRLRRAVSGG
jgi:hypothetical protein